MKLTLKKINDILSKRQRKKYFALIVFTLFGMLFESLGLGILIPIISLIINPSFVESLISNYGLNYLASYSNESILIFILFFMGFIYLTKTLYLTLITHKQNKFIYGLNAFISKTLYARYLNQSYDFFLKTNTAEVTKNIMVEVQLLTKYFIAIMHLLNECLLLTTVFLTLLIIEPLGIILVGVLFFLFGYAFFKLTNKRVHFYAQKRKKYDEKLSKLILEGYGGSKEVKLMNRGDFFTNKFDHISDLKKVISAQQSTLTQLPRLYIELLAVLAVIILVGLMLLQNQPSEIIISKVGVFTVAVFKIIPSYSKISAAIQNVKYNHVSLEIIHKKLDDLKIEVFSDEVEVAFQESIKLESISFSYENQKIIEDITLQIKKGDTIGFIGASGSGKSTLIDLINGLLKPTMGEIKIDNIPIQNCIKSWQQKIGYVPQQNFLTDSSIASNIAFGIAEEEIDKYKLEQAILKAELKPFLDSLPNGVDTKVGERGLQISGGQMQRIGIARALYNNTDVLIFDEATSALDEATEENVLSAISELKKTKTIIVITHRKNALKDCDKIYKIENQGIKLIKNG